MEKYIVFLKNNRTGEEFTSLRQGYPGTHSDILMAEAQHHPAPTYTIHTTYTFRELDSMLESMKRWTGTVPEPLASSKFITSF